MDPILLVVLLGGAALLLFGTGTNPAMVAASGKAQAIAAGQGNQAAQQISAGSGNQTAQDISAVGGLVSAAAPIFASWNRGATTTPGQGLPQGASSPNDALGGTQSSNNTFPIGGAGVDPSDPFALGELSNPIDRDFGNTGTGTDPSQAQYSNLSANISNDLA